MRKLRVSLPLLILSLTSASPALAAGLSAEGEPRYSGRGLALTILVLLSLEMLYVLGRFVLADEGTASAPRRVRSARIPVLSLLGLAVAVYLTIIETTPASAVCGPVGNCNAVQNSPYAMLFGLIPVGLFGAVGYLFILAMWWLQNQPRWQKTASLALFGAAVFGQAFSIYLTYIEVYVIHAVCIWCLTSAVLMALILWESLPAALDTMEAEAI